MIFWYLKDFEKSKGGVKEFFYTQAVTPYASSASSLRSSPSSAPGGRLALPGASLRRSLCLRRYHLGPNQVDPFLTILSLQQLFSNSWCLSAFCILKRGEQKPVNLARFCQTGTE